MQHREDAQGAVVFDNTRPVHMRRQQNGLVVRRAEIAPRKRRDGLKGVGVLLLMRIQDELGRFTGRRLGQALCAGDAVEHQKPHDELARRWMDAGALGCDRR